MKKKYTYDDLDTISIERFVHTYLGAGEFIDCSNLKHVGLKSFGNPFVIGISNDIAFKNMDLVKEGKLLLVLDCKGNLGTYLNPVQLMNLMDKEELEKIYNELSRKRIQVLGDLMKHYMRFKEIDETLTRLKEYEQFVESIGKKSDLKKVKIFTNKTSALKRKGDFQ